MPTVVNVYTYGGRKAAEAAGVIYIGRPSPLGNPFSHQEGTLAQYRVATREEAISRYEEWLWQQIEAGNQAVLRALRDIREDTVLGCFCVPRRCHGDVIVKVWQILTNR
jgi:hypothetical protein